MRANCGFMPPAIHSRQAAGNTTTDAAALAAPTGCCTVPVMVLRLSVNVTTALVMSRPDNSNGSNVTSRPLIITDLRNHPPARRPPVVATYRPGGYPAVTKVPSSFARPAVACVIAAKPGPAVQSPPIAVNCT